MSILSCSQVSLQMPALHAASLGMVLHLSQCHRGTPMLIILKWIAKGILSSVQ